MNIRVLNSSKEFNGKEVLHIDELDFKEGYTYALMGLNGSGKSTFLQCISGLDTFTRGKVSYDNYNSIDFVKKNISVMLQKPYLFNCSVLENITMGLKFRKFSKEIIEKRITTYLKYLVVDDLLHKNARELSGGEQEKVALLRTAILETEVTFLDEPTASMDIENILKSEKLIKTMSQEKRTVILVTHDLLQAERVADYIIFMDKGKVIEQGEKYEVLNFPKHKLLKQIFKNNNIKDI